MPSLLLILQPRPLNSFRKCIYLNLFVKDVDLIGNCDFRKDRKMALLQLGSVEEAVAALIVINS